MIPKCPRCGSTARRVPTQFKHDKYTCCGLWAWGKHPLVDEATHMARKRAHNAFDPLWKEGHLTRTEAYKVLSAMLGIDSKDCHMKLMDVETARRVPRIVKQIKEDLAIV